MNEEEKKAVCELKNYITKRNRSYTKLDRHDKAINNLLNLIGNLQKENTEFEKLSKDCSYSVDIVRENTKLRRQVFDLELENTKLKKQNQCYINSIQAIIPVLTQDYIPKQEIKDKIEELDIAISECIYLDEDDEKYKKAVEKDKLCLLNQKRALQELLEGRE